MRKVVVGAVLGFAVVTNLFFVNCGGPSVRSGFGSSLGGASGDAGAFGGTWIGKHCAQIQPGQSARDVYIITTINHGLVHHRKTTQVFASDTCSGSGTILGSPMDLGTVTFTSIEDYYNNQTFYRGDWADPMASVSKLIWIAKGTNTMCVIYDNNPTSYPTALDIHTTAESIGDDICYTKQ